MAEATRECATFNLRKAVGKGPRIWAGKVTIDDGETIDTGLDTIEGMGCMVTEDTAVDGESPILFVDSIGTGATSGVITFQTAKLDAYADLTGVIAYMLVVGTARGGIAT